MSDNLMSESLHPFRKLAWIGTGVMGAAMAEHLKAGTGAEISLFNRSPEKAKAAAERMGGKAAESIAEAVRDAELIVTMVGYPKDVEEVYLGPDGIFQHARRGAYMIDMTTSDPALAERLFREGGERGFHVLDAPVSGGDSGARAGTLSIMVGGSREDFDAVLPCLKTMGKNIVYMGAAGNGQHTKAANQIAVAGATAAYTEAMQYCARVNLDFSEVRKAIGGGAAASWQLENMAPRAMAGDFAPGFFVKHFIKDMRIAVSEMEKRGESLEMLNTVLKTYETFADMGHEDDGTQALILYYREREKRS